MHGLHAMADAIEEVAKEVWDREYRDGYRLERCLESPATKGDVLELMELIVSELRRPEPGDVENNAPGTKF